MVDAVDIPPCDMTRSWDFADMAVRSDGAGRTVQAYVTPFDVASEVRDYQGHYNETIGRSAFAKTLAERGLNFQVLFNHGMTFDGRPDGNLMVPVGVPRMLEQHERGLYSETEYLENPLASSVLEGIKKGAIRGYSFRGKWIKSQRSAAATRGQLPTIHRSEIAMNEFGPVLFPVHAGATILGTRMETMFVDELRRQFAAEDYDAVRQLLGLATPTEPAGQTTPPGAGPDDDDPASGQSSPSPVNIRAAIKARNRIRRIA